MNTTELKLELFGLIDYIDDIEILEAIMLLLKKTSPGIINTQTEKWDDLPIELQNDINEGLMQAKNEELMDHDSVMKKYDKWLTK